MTDLLSASSPARSAKPRHQSATRTRKTRTALRMAFTAALSEGLQPPECGDFFVVSAAARVAVDCLRNVGRRRAGLGRRRRGARDICGCDLASLLLRKPVAACASLASSGQAMATPAKVTNSSAPANLFMIGSFRRTGNDNPGVRLSKTARPSRTSSAASGQDSPCRSRATNVSQGRLPGYGVSRPRRCRRHTAATPPGQLAPLGGVRRR